MAYLPDNHYCCVCEQYLGMDDGDGVCSTCEEIVSIDELTVYRFKGSSGKFHIKDQNGQPSALCNWRLMIYPNRADAHEEKPLYDAFKEDCLCQSCVDIYNRSYV